VCVKYTYTYPHKNNKVDSFCCLFILALRMLQIKTVYMVLYNTLIIKLI